MTTWDSLSDCPRNSTTLVVLALTSSTRPLLAANNRGTGPPIPGFSFRRAGEVSMYYAMCSAFPSHRAFKRQVVVRSQAFVYLDERLAEQTIGDRMDERIVTKFSQILCAVCERPAVVRITQPTNAHQELHQ